MAKKKRRHYKRRNKSKSNSVNDRHHLLWTRRRWERGILQKIRLHPYCIVSIPKNTLHKYIHNNMSYIPTPSEKSVIFALANLKMLENAGAICLNDSIEKRLKVLIALFDCIEQPTADALKEQLRIICEYKNPS